jgi:hypothetical protein
VYWSPPWLCFFGSAGLSEQLAKFYRKVVAIWRPNVDINVAESLSWLTGRSLHVTAFSAEQALLPVVSYKGSNC